MKKERPLCDMNALIGFLVCFFFRWWAYRQKYLVRKMREKEDGIQGKKCGL